MARRFFRTHQPPTIEPEPASKVPSAGFPTWHAVYFIQVGDLIKIGWSQQPELRAKRLGGILLGYIATRESCAGQRCKHEREVHRRWAHLRVAGREVFTADPALLDWISRRCTAASTGSKPGSDEPA